MDTLCRQVGIFPDKNNSALKDDTISLSPQTIEFARITTAELESEKNGFPIEFAKNVAEILKRDDELLKKGTYNSNNPHPLFKDTKLLAGVDFTHDEVCVLGNYKDMYDGISVIGLPDGIEYDNDKGTFTIPEVKIISNIELHKNNPNLRFAIVVFEYHWKTCDTYLWGLPKFEKTLLYLDYRKS